MQTRRHVLEVLALGGVASGCAAPQLPDPTAPWRNPGAGESDPRRWALAHAILAPNPHNRQPWLIELPGADEIVLYADLTRLLPATDPPNRQITIGCGAFLELLDLAARQRGLRADITLWPEGEPQPVLDTRPVAHVRLIPDAAARPDDLFVWVTRRHTNRQPYDLRSPPRPDELARIVRAAAPLTADWVVEPSPQLGRLIEIGQRAFAIEARTSATNMETVRLLRIGREEIARHPDGIALDGPMIVALSHLGLMSREAMADPNSFASKSGLDMWARMIAATPAFVWLKGPDNSRATQIAAGRAYARMHLTAMSAGIQFHPWSMPLQEFPEMAGPYRETQAALGATPDAPLQMLVRAGRAKPVPPAPRWPLETHLRSVARGLPGHDGSS